MPRRARSWRSRRAVVAARAARDALDGDAAARVRRAAAATPPSGASGKIRLTAGDAATAAGVPVAQAEAALADAAAAGGGALEVTDSGAVVYALPVNFMARRLANSAAAQREQALKQFREVGYKALRVAFGASLLASIAVVYILISAVSQEERREQRQDRGGGGGGFVNFGGPNIWFDVWFWGPDARSRYRDPEEMSFLESVFSVVFGDGDGDPDAQARSYQAVGSLLREKGGSVIAEQVAPLMLEMPAGAGDELAGEEFMLDVLLRFGGTPEFDPESGKIIYEFPDAQITAGLEREALPEDEHEYDAGMSSLRAEEALRRQRDLGISETDDFLARAAAAERGWEAGAVAAAGPYLEERETPFTLATPGQVALVGALGLFNLGGVAVLASKVADPYVQMAMRTGRPGSEPFVLAAALLPALTAYAVSFFAIPGLRYLWNERENAARRERNGKRRRAANALRLAGVQKALKAAARRARTTSVGADEVVYSSDKTVEEQRLEERRFDEKLGRKP